MKYILIFLLITNNALGQKVYLTREGVQRLTNQLRVCRETQYELIKVKSEVINLKKTITEKDSISKLFHIKLDSIIETSNEKYKLLENKYNEALALIPKKKRRKL